MRLPAAALDCCKRLCVRACLCACVCLYLVCLSKFVAVCERCVFVHWVHRLCVCVDLGYVSWPVVKAWRMRIGETGRRGEKRRMTWQLPYSTPNHWGSVEAVCDRERQCLCWRRWRLRVCCLCVWCWARCEISQKLHLHCLWCFVFVSGNITFCLLIWETVSFSCVSEREGKTFGKCCNQEMQNTKKKKKSNIIYFDSSGGSPDAFLRRWLHRLY